MRAAGPLFIAGAIVATVVLSGCVLVSSRIHEGQGIVLSAAGKQEQAVSQFTAAMEADPGFVASYWNRASANLALNRFDEVIGDCTLAVQLDPGPFVPYYLRGRAHLAKEQYERAVEDFTAAIQRQPAESRLYNERAAAHAALRDLDSAIADYTRSLEVSRHDQVPAYGGRGIAYQQKGEYLRALSDLDHAVELVPQSPWWRRERGRVYVALGRKAEAMAEFNRVIELTDIVTLQEEMRREVERLSAAP